MTTKAAATTTPLPESVTKTLRIGIIHARWNAQITSTLLTGCLDSLTKHGVPRTQIVVQSVPGSYELPLAVQRMAAASQTSSSQNLVSAATDLLAGGGGGDAAAAAGSEAPGGEAGPGGPLDAIIAIGVLVKGSTMHFEYIAEAVSHGLMRVQLDCGVPVVFGVLTCLGEEQARTRAGLPKGGGDQESEYESGVRHNHGEDWGVAAVEMGGKRRAWGEGRFV